MKLKLLQLVRGLLAPAAFFVFPAALLAADPAPSTQIIYLSGKGKDDAKVWDFYCTGGRKAGTWTTIHVPSCWEQEGFGKYEYGLEARPSKKVRHPPMADEHGLYRTDFAAPAEWASHRVKLVFQGVMTDATVKLNGQIVGPTHQGAFYRFEYDIAPLLHVGATNRLEVDVAKKSANVSVNQAEREGDYWNFGGIFRPVYLEVSPTESIDRVAIDAQANGSFTSQVFLSAASAPNADTAIETQLLDDSGRELGSPVKTPIPSGATELTVRTQLDHPSTWTAETPALYRARFTLLVAGQPVHIYPARFGFRTFEVRARDGVYLNGSKIQLKGSCRHSFWPETGRTLSREVCYDDVRLMKEANMNAVRLSHYPPDVDFLEACDELGIYVLDELGGWHGMYDTPTGAKLIGEMVRRDVNHPSIVFWDNGNEGGFNTANDGQFAKWDPQHRPVLHPWALFSNVATNHYRPYDETVQFCKGPDIFMPTEFLHGLYDGGIGAGMEDYWKVMAHSPLCAGGFIWAFLDESVARTDENGRLDSKDNWAPDGIAGPHREKEGSFLTIRQVWSPVQIATVALPADLATPERSSESADRGGARPSAFAKASADNPGALAYPRANNSGLALPLENLYDFTNFSRCRFEWELGAFAAPTGGTSSGEPSVAAGTLDRPTGHRTVAKGLVKSPSIAPRATGTLELPSDLPWKDADILYITAYDPAGRSLWTWSWNVPKAAATSAPQESVASGSAAASGNKGRTEVTVGDVSLKFDPATGQLAQLSRGGRVFALSHGPRIVAYLRKDKAFTDIGGQSTLTDFRTAEAGGDAVVTANYSGLLRSVSWRITPSGKISLDYEVAFTGPVDLLGVTFDFPEKDVRSKRWLGGGPYHVWRNRLKGSTTDVWQTAYNDSVPGDTWNFPEFKGFFPDWKWMQFETAEGRLTFWDGNESPVHSTLEGSYFGVFKANDGRVGPVLPLPLLGIGVFRVIPAMGNKTATPDLVGPQSQTPVLSGSYHGSFQFQVGN